MGKKDKSSKRKIREREVATEVLLHKTSEARPRRGRGKAKGHEISAYVEQNGKIKLTFDETTWKPIGRHGSWYQSTIGMHTRDICEPFHDQWSDVNNQHKRLIQDRLLIWFDIDYEYKDGILRWAVDREAAKCYKEWKNELHVHFKKHGGIENEATAREARPTSLRNVEHWRLCCDRFTSTKFWERSDKNKDNRRKQNYPSLHGRKSYTQHRHQNVDAATQEPRFVIDNWAEMHCHGPTWVNEEAEQTYHRLEAERATQMSSQTASGSSSCSASETSIMERVLGKRRGHMVGVGPTLPKKSGMFSTSGTPGASSSGVDPQYVARMQEHYNEQQRIMYETMCQLVQAMGQMNPTMQLPIIPSPRPFEPQPTPPPSDSDGGYEGSARATDAENLDD